MPTLYLRIFIYLGKEFPLRLLQLLLFCVLQPDGYCCFWARGDTRQKVSEMHSVFPLFFCVITPKPTRPLTARLNVRSPVNIYQTKYNNIYVYRSLSSQYNLGVSFCWIFAT